ncbi:MAG: hypothetical protein SO016_14425 [Lachnospiraceae bacterium]|nr:hypothetical protein [Robinsoniella sp.]MDY3767864.1 hypothetical protein [Lachnospiraceae bacterium]
MKKYEGNTVKEVICNCCGKRIAVEDGISEEEIFHVEKRWGYFSKRDMQKDSFDLCESCYEQIVASFIIPVKTEEETEFFGC